MTCDESLARYGLVPKLEDLPAVRGLLREEMRLEGAGEDRNEDVALLCAVQLFSRGLSEDVLLVWEAKQSSFDLSCIIDVELLCGAGFEPTKAVLAERGAGEILAYIESCAADHFQDFSPERYLDHYRQYFDFDG